MSQSVETENICATLKDIPFPLYHPVKITDTLQGGIYRAFTSQTTSIKPHTVVIKLTDRNQHNQSIAIAHNNTVHHGVQENIVSEQTILKHLSAQSNPSSITKYISFFKTNTWYILVQQDGGCSLFDFVVRAHQLLKTNKIDKPHWKEVVKVISKQMIQSIAFIHSNNVCHNDISLENWLINDVNINVYSTGQFQFELDDIRIKLCDFGLARLYSNSTCLRNTYTGKRQYQSPETIALKPGFDAKKSDIWGFGVCLFMLSFGSPPWNVAHVDDALFCAIMDGHMLSVLNAWNLFTYVDPYTVDLLQSIFRYEADRINTRELRTWTQRIT
eukprot:104299_1